MTQHPKSLRIALALTTVLCLVGTAQATSFSKATYDGAKADLKTLYKGEREACATLKDNAKDVCVEQVKARDKVSAAQLTYNYTGSAKDERNVYQARYEAAYSVAKEMCDDSKGPAKDLCVREAKTTRDKAKANVKLTKKVEGAVDDAAASRMKADYKLAVEKCETLAADPKQICVATAKARYNERW